ncbi:unnamed protein product, partial [Symbiodinium necroappetens]
MSSSCPPVQRKAPPVVPPQYKAPPPPLPEAELQGLPLAVANLRCVLEAAHAGGWVAWRDLAAAMTVDDRLALAEFSSALMVVPPANMPSDAALKEKMKRRLPATAATAGEVPDTLKDPDAGIFFYHHGGAAVGLVGWIILAAAGSTAYPRRRG